VQLGYTINPTKRVLQYLRKLKDKRLAKKFSDLIFDEIPEDPFGIGELKVGDLNGVYVAEFIYAKTEYKVAYRIMDNQIIPILLAGPHENFYDQLKRLL
jgi:Txe/YoeB family toxin of Txe-Axe toxin-antitoxin module